VAADAVGVEPPAAASSSELMDAIRIQNRSSGSSIFATNKIGSGHWQSGTSDLATIKEITP